MERARTSVTALALRAVALLVTFAALTWFVRANPVWPTDVQIERTVQALYPPSLAAITTTISWVGFPPQSTIIDAIIVAIIFLRRLRWQAGCAGFAAAGSAGLWFAVALLIHRPRPTADLVRVAVEIPFGSFPSGHVLNLTAFFGFLCYLAWTEPRSGFARTGAVVVCGVLVASIGFSRIYAGEHWPTDVLGGYLLGSAWLLLTIALYRWRADRGRSDAPIRSRP